MGKKVIISSPADFNFVPPRSRLILAEEGIKEDVIKVFDGQEIRTLPPLTF